MLPRQRCVCVECGAGEAEVSYFMAEHFNLAIATDACPPKSAYPVAVDGPIGYVKCRAENLPLPSDSVDMVVSMQALHHFDLAGHLTEARRVLSPGGIFAALAWGEMVLPVDVRTACDDFLAAVKPFWEAERGWVVSGYNGLKFEGEALALPKAAMRKTVTVEALVVLFRGWSAYKAGQRDCAEVLAATRLRLRQLGHAQITVAWPIVGQVFRKLP
ncbi:class I SAM-dependent methyltransferase [uncultured Roseovarius sp.]|uniref:class I SAM-dependent methyltransferase n=1 Tax=uncultured Roseovarius sp. TaxID=293344 RepID=UPI0026217612|nr:class I SAM-dependent methyltransferase [uncultured Roseovarius sp.]